MKKIACLIVFFGCFSAFHALADSFSYNDELLSGVRSSLSAANVVRIKSAGSDRNQAIFEICSKRIRLLDNISKGRYGEDVAKIVNQYMQVCKMHIGDFDIVQLRRSRNFGELSRNASSISRAYRVLHEEAVRNGAKSKKGKGNSESKKTRFLHTREGRQESTKRGSSKRK